MTTFDNRENAFENKFAHDADLAFKATARRDRLIGLWAAEKLGKAGDAADEYARSVVVADLAELGDEDIVAKLVVDLAATGTTEADIRAALVSHAAEAHRQLAAGN